MSASSSQQETVDWGKPYGCRRSRSTAASTSISSAIPGFWLKSFQHPERTGVPNSLLPITSLGHADPNSVPWIAFDNDRKSRGWNSARHILIKQPEVSIFAVS
jgi:hypothetical protein